MSTWSSLSAAAQAKATTLYQALLSFWNNPSGVSALMGNIWHESASTFDGRIVQGYGEADLTGFCQDYTDDVNDGTISESSFVNGGPNGGGYGLCQWTYFTRKQGLYDYNISSGTNNIGDNTMQTYYIHQELPGYPSAYNALITATENNIDLVTETIELIYFGPADPYSSLADRQQNAREIYNNLSGLPPIPPGPTPGHNDILFLKHFIDFNHKRRYIY